MSNILKPVGFVLILAAVATGAYFFGQSSKEPAAASGGPSARPGMVQRMKDFVSSDDAGVPGQAAAPVPPDSGSAVPSTPAVPASTKPRVPAPLAVVTATVPAQVSALSGDMVLTKAQARVRLIGVRAPVRGAEVEQAREALAKMIDDGKVTLQFEGADRSAAYVWKGNRLLNESMVGLGWSRASHARFLTAEAAARHQGAGLWSPEGWMGVNP